MEVVALILFTIVIISFISTIVFAVLALKNNYEEKYINYLFISVLIVNVANLIMQICIAFIN